MRSINLSKTARVDWRVVGRHPVSMRRNFASFSIYVYSAGEKLPAVEKLVCHSNDEV